MGFLYNLLILISSVFVWFLQFFSKKMKLFVQGRKTVFETLRSAIKKEDKTIWFHCSSLGEFEQGLPIMEAVKRFLPQHKLVITFFSPSGYEVKKKDPIADVITYLPLDTSKNARIFLNIVHPTLAVFIKYEFWPNYLFELKKKNIATLLVSGLFRPNQQFFKTSGNFMRKSLQTFHHFFVQNENSKELLKKINFNNVTVSGDARFDRVSHQIEHDNYLEFIKNFKQDSLCIVCGSTWPEDEKVLLEYINTVSEKVKFIIAPHKIEATKIKTFRTKLKKESILFSEIHTGIAGKEQINISEFTVLIIDTIGLLTKIYSYADITYVGGAMGNKGLHNILEAATFGVPVVIGQHFEKFPEAIKLQNIGGLFSINNAEECSQILSKLVNDKYLRTKTGMIAGHFINSNTGATQKTMEYIEKLYRESII